MNNRYKPPLGHPPLVDSTHYHPPENVQGRGGPFPHWYRSHRPHRFYPARSMRPPVPHYVRPTPIPDRPSCLVEGEWWKDPYGDDWDRVISQSTSNKHSQYRRKDVSHMHFQSKKIKPLNSGNERHEFQRYRPSVVPLPLSSSNTRFTSSTPSKVRSGITESAFPNRGASTYTSGKFSAQAKLPKHPIPNGTGCNNPVLDSQKSEETQTLEYSSGNVTQECLTSKGETTCVETSKYKSVSEINSSVQSEIDTPVRIVSDIPSLKPVTLKDNVNGDNFDTVNKSNADCSPSASDILSRSVGSVLEPVQSVLAKRPVVKLTRLSDEELQKYSIRSPSTYTVEEPTSQNSETESSVPSSDFNVSSEGIQDYPKLNANSLGTRECGSDATESRTNIVGENHSEQESLTVDPKVMPMSLVLQSSSSGKAVYKVFSSTKPRTTYPQKHPAKKSHVGHFDINKLKERFREAMPNLPITVMKRIAREKAETQSKAPTEASVEPIVVLKSDAENADSVPELCVKDDLSSTSPEIENAQTESTDISTKTPETQTSEEKNQTDVECIQMNASNDQVSSLKQSSYTEKRSTETCSASDPLLVVDSLQNTAHQSPSDLKMLTFGAKKSNSDAEFQNSAASIRETPLCIEVPHSHKEEQHDSLACATHNDDACKEAIQELYAVKDQTTPSQKTEDTQNFSDKVGDSAFSPQSEHQLDYVCNAESSVNEDSVIEQPHPELMADPEPLLHETHQSASESEPSAVDAAEGLLYLAKSGGRIFPIDEQPSVAENMFQPESLVVEAGPQSGKDPIKSPLTNVANTVSDNELSHESAQRLPSPEIGATYSEVSGGNAERNLPKRYHLTSCSYPPPVSSTPLVVTQPSVIMQSASPNEGTVTLSAPQAVVPPPAILVLGAVQIPKKARTKAKRQKLKAKRDKILRPLLPKANVNTDNSDGNKIQVAEQKVSTNSDTLQSNNVANPEVEVEPEPELLDLSMKSTRSASSAVAREHGQLDDSDDTITGDEYEFTESKSPTSPNCDSNCVSTITQSVHESSPNPDNSGGLTSTLIIQNTSNTEQSQSDVTATQDRLKLIISNLRENLGKQNPAKIKKVSRRVAKTEQLSNSISGDNQTASAARSNRKTGRKNARTTTRNKSDPRKTRKRGCKSKQNADPGSMIARSKSTSSQKGKLCNRTKSAKHGVVKVFYTRLRAQNDMKRVRERSGNKGGKCRNQQTSEILVQNNSQSDTENVDKATNLSDANPGDVYKFESLASNGENIVPVAEGKTMEDIIKADDSSQQTEDLPTAEDLSVKTKPARAGHHKPDGRRRRKGKRKRPMSSLEEYKKKLGCEDTDDLPTILPPKRRRTQNKTPSPPKKQMEGPIEDNVKRLAREFPRHNWLENKIKNITAPSDTSTRRTTTATNGASSSPAPNGMSGDVFQTELTADNSSYKALKEHLSKTPPELTPIGLEDGTRSDNPVDFSEILVQNENNVVCDNNANFAEGQTHLHEEKTVSNTEDDQVNSNEKTPLHSTIHNASGDKHEAPGAMRGVPGDSTTDTVSTNHVAINMNVNATDVSTPIAAGRDGGADTDDKMVPHCRPREEWMEIGGSLLQGSTYNNLSGTGTAIDTEDAVTSTISNQSVECVQIDSDRDVMNDTQVLPSGTASSDCGPAMGTEKVADDTPTNTISNSDGAIPLNLSVKPQELLTETLKNGPPVLKVHPQVKQVDTPNPEQLTVAVKESVLSIGEALQNVQPPQLPEPHRIVAEARPAVRKPNVPPIPALVPLPVSQCQWLPTKSQASKGVHSGPTTAIQGQWNGHDSSANLTPSRASGSGAKRSSSADATMSGSRGVNEDNGCSTQVAWKRSSLDSAASDHLQTSPQRPQQRSPPALDIGQILMREYKALEKLSKEKEIELKEILTLLKHKKEEIVRLTKQHRAMPKHIRDAAKNSSCDEAMIKDPEWLEVYKLRASLASENSEPKMTSANSNNNSSNLSPVETLPQISASKSHPEKGDESSKGISSEKSATSSSIGVTPKVSRKRNRPNQGTDITGKRSLMSSQSSSPPKAHSNSSVDSVWSMMDIPSEKPSAASCPYVPNTTKYDVPEFCGGIDYTVKAHPAHSQQPFETAGVIITPQSKDATQNRNPRRTHSSHAKGPEINSSDGNPNPEGIPRYSGVPESKPPQRSTGNVPEDVPRTYHGVPQQAGGNPPCHMTLPVASPTKFNPSSEYTNQSTESSVPAKSQMLEYVDLRKSPENIVRRVPLPPGFHYGVYPVERFVHQTPSNNHGIRPSATPSAMHPIPQLPTPVDRQRRMKIVEQDRQTQRIATVPYPPGIPVPRPEGVHYMQQGPPGGVVQASPAHRPPIPSAASVQGVQTYTPIRPDRNHMTNSNSQRSINNKQPQQPKEQIPAHFNTAPGELHPGQFMTRAPVPFPQPTSSEANMAGHGGQITTAPGHHPPHLVQALVSQPVRPRMPQYLPVHRMPDPRSAGRGQPFYNALRDPQGQQIRHPGVRHHFPRHGVPVQQFAVPNPPTGHMRQPSPSEVQQGQFLELSRGSHPDNRPQAFHPAQQYDGRHSMRQSPVHQNPHHQSPIHQSPIHPSPARRSPAHQNPMHPGPIHQGHAPQIATHPFEDRHQTNPNPINRSHMPSGQTPAESGSHKRPSASGARHTDFSCSMCHGKANMICSRCEGVRYCSKECQIKGWIEHSRHCKPRPP